MKINLEAFSTVLVVCMFGVIIYSSGILISACFPILKEFVRRLY
jgi:hypothetical protein